MSKLFIVDDHQMMVDGIVAFFEKETTIEIVGVAYGYEEAIRKIVNGNLSVDILLTDLNLQGKTGLDLIVAIKNSLPTIKSIVFTMYFERSLIKQLMDLKVDGFVEKNAPQEELKQAVNKVMNGGTYYPNNLLEKVKSYEVLYNGGTIKDSFASRYKLSTHRKNLNNKTNTYTPLDLYKLLK